MNTGICESVDSCAASHDKDTKGVFGLVFWCWRHLTDFWRWFLVRCWMPLCFMDTHSESESWNVQQHFTLNYAKFKTETACSMWEMPLVDNGERVNKVLIFHQCSGRIMVAWRSDDVCVFLRWSVLLLHHFLRFMEE